MALHTCCCCVNLRTGAIVIAILGILGSFGQLHDKEHIYIGIISVVVGVLANLFLLHGAIKYNKTTKLSGILFLSSKLWISIRNRHMYRQKLSFEEIYI